MLEGHDPGVLHHILRGMLVEEQPMRQSAHGVSVVLELLGCDHWTVAGTVGSKFGARGHAYLRPLKPTVWDRMQGKR